MSISSTQALLRYQKLKTTLQHQFLKKNYMKALKALTFAEKYHSGIRKDGYTPEFQHQLDICHYILTLKGVENEEDVLCSALLHDICEDYEVEYFEIYELFGPKVAEAVELLTKKFKWVNKLYKDYFSKIAKNPIASIVKGVDRINNITTMLEVFTPEKQLDYVRMVDKYFLPMLREAKHSFPEQIYAYENIELFLIQLSKFVNTFYT